MIEGRLKTAIIVTMPLLHWVFVAGLGLLATVLSVFSRRWRLVRRISFAYAFAAVRELTGRGRK